MEKAAYSKKDIIKALKDVGLQKGDTAFFSTSLGMLGKVEGVQSQDDLNALFLETIKEVMGMDGTILVPTYSYTFGSSTKGNPKNFDPSTTPSETGPFPSFFLKQKRVIRSLDPMVSVAGLGPSSSNLFKNLPKNSYGKDCLFSRLINHPNSKCISIGLGPNWVPFLHHADWLAQVPFRYDKQFAGTITYSTGIEHVRWNYSVRASVDQSRANAHELGRKAVNKGIWTYAPLGRARVYGCSYKEFFYYTMGLLEKDKWLTAIGPPYVLPDRN